MRCVHVYMQKMVLRYLVGIWQQVNKNKLVEWKVPIKSTVGIESADLKEKSFFESSVALWAA